MTLSPFAQEAHRGYAAMRQAAPQATLHLLAGASYYMARFNCAKVCGSLLDSRRLQDHGEGYFTYAIPMEEMHSALQRLSQQHSIALLDTMTDAAGTRFVCIWKIERAAAPAPSTNVDDY